MAEKVIMPKQGNSVESCIIVEWKKQVGETIEAGEVICEAETDKSTIEVESNFSGTVLKLLYNVDDEAPVMEPIAYIGEPGEKIDDSDAEEVTKEDNSDKEATKEETKIEVPTIEAVKGTGASPRARNLAEKKGIDVETVPATGPKGLIIERDVEKLSSQPLSAAARANMNNAGNIPATGSGIGGRILSSDLAEKATQSVQQEVVEETEVNEYEEIKVRGIRKVTAVRMLESMQTSCQLTLNATADVTAMKRLRKGFKNSDERLGLQKITLNDLVMFAVTRTLPDFPEFNTHFLGDTMRRYHNVDLGMATDTAKGLMVPVIRSAQKLSLLEISNKAKALATLCHEGKAQPDDISGSTFTVTNVGAFGVDSFTPVINLPEVAILGVGGIHLNPVQKDNEVKFVPSMTFSLTIDHRAVDGGPAARFLQALIKNIESIDLLLAR